MTFQDKIAEILGKYDPGRKYLAPAIAKKFMRNQDLILTRLKEIYANGGVANLDAIPKVAAKVEAPVEEAPEMVADMDEAVAEEANAPEEVTSEATDDSAAEVEDQDEVMEDKEEASE